MNLPFINPPIKRYFRYPQNFQNLTCCKHIASFHLFFPIKIKIFKLDNLYLMVYTTLIRLAYTKLRLGAICKSSTGCLKHHKAIPRSLYQLFWLLSLTRASVVGSWKRWLVMLPFELEERLMEISKRLEESKRIFDEEMKKTREMLKEFENEFRSGNKVF